MTIRDKLRALPALAGPFPSFDTTAAPDDPAILFVEWLGEAISAGIREPHAVVLSTVDEAGHPDERFLLLKEVDVRGWQVACVRTSPKGCQIAAQPHVALTSYWQTMGRQVRVRGIAAEMEDTARREDFLARSEGARAVALTGRQSGVLSDPDTMDAEVAEQRQRLASAPDTVAPDWALYAVRPLAVEFWQGDTGRRHTRLVYRREPEGWRRHLLYP